MPFFVIKVTMKSTKLLALGAAVAIAAGGIFVFKAHAANEAGPFNRGSIIKRIIERLELKDEQIEKIKGELRAEKGTLAPMLRSLHEARKELRETIQSGADESAIRAASAKVAAVDADLAVERAKLHTKIAPILTEEQIAKVKEMEAKVDDFVLQVLKTVGDKLEQ